MRVIVLADQQGRGVQRTLQKLLNEDMYLVSCLWKSEATLTNILDTPNDDLLTLNKNDHVIIIGGCNDKNPFAFQLSVNKWLHALHNTNIIFCQIPYNANLNVHKLNYELKFACTTAENAHYLDLEYQRYIPKGRYFTVSMCRFVLRQLLHIDYKNNYSTYYKKKCEGKTRALETFNKCIQTDLTAIHSMTKIDKSTQIDQSDLNVKILSKSDTADTNNNNLFRL